MNEYQQGEKEALEEMKKLLKGGMSKDDVLCEIEKRLDGKYNLKIGDVVKTDGSGKEGIILNTEYGNNKNCAIILTKDYTSPRAITKSALTKTNERYELIIDYIQQGAKELGLLGNSKRGIWEYLPLIPGIKCSECGTIYDFYDGTVFIDNKRRKTTYRYCPECGAKMEERVFEK